MRINKILLLLIFSLINTEEIPINNSISDKLILFKPFLGKIFRGKIINSKVNDSIYNIHRWYSVLNGNAIRMTHEINNGEYLSEAFILWDEKLNRLRSWHFNSSGIVVIKDVKFVDDNLIFIEDVSKNKNGITKVKTIYNFIYNGKLQNRTRFLMDNIWVDGGESIYDELVNTDIVKD